MEGRKRSSIFMAVALLLCHVANGSPLVSNTGRVVRTIKGEVGYVIDCVDIYSQPAFDHPLLKQLMRPRGIPEGMERRKPSRKSLLGRTRLAKSGGCPNGTLLRGGPRPRRALPSLRPWLLVTSGAELRIFHEECGNKGLCGPPFGSTLERNTRGDNEQACFNTMCPGFVQTSQTAMLGQDEDGNWWVHADDEAVGYWPGSLFTGLSWWANDTMMGGEVYDTFAGGQHTTTQMGNGLFPIESKTDNRKAACIWNPSYMDSDGHVRPLDDPVSILVTSPSCYDERECRILLHYSGSDTWELVWVIAHSGPPKVSF
ncbi:hypothetical protein EJ110_NYTH16875 [Nymphaea thermarum]|nr:hypothetical protein EJ110_NYTH16875 [Nymphaea thermarum]